jgi:hypothetical protein
VTSDVPGVSAIGPSIASVDKVGNGPVVTGRRRHASGDDVRPVEVVAVGEIESFDDGAEF